MSIKVKICGLTNLADATAAVNAGADLLGFIFYEPSPRAVTPETVRLILDELPGQALSVGVFVNAPLDVVRDTLSYCGLDAAQLHGGESPEFVRQLPGRGYKALRPQSQAEAESLIREYQPSLFQFQAAAFDKLPTFLIDAYHPGLYGGTGHVADWSMAASVARRYPTMLAGSLTPANVAAAIEAVQPWGVDVSSGVERAKGQKDHAKIQAFIHKAKGS